jgi:uncharacterized OB-fold protein
MPGQIPLVDYLVLGDSAHLKVRECEACAARFFDRRNACANCGNTSFREAQLPRTGVLKSFTIVHVAAPGVPVPFVATLVDCGGTSVRANLVNVAPDPTVIKTGMKVRLVTKSIGDDSLGVDAIGFAFEPQN